MAFSVLLLGLHGVMAGAGVTLTGTIITFMLIMIVTVIIMVLITTNSMDRETGTMILGIGGVLPIGIKPLATNLELRIRFEPLVIA